MSLKTKGELELINLIYKLNEFSEKDIIEIYITGSDDFSSNLSKLKDRLFNLCDIGTLQFDGDFFKVVPPTERLSYRKFFYRILS